MFSKKDAWINKYKRSERLVSGAFHCGFSFQVHFLFFSHRSVIWNVPKIASYQEATAVLQDVLYFLETKGNKKTANELAKVIANVQSDWLKQRRSQSKLTNVFKTVWTLNNCESVVSYNIENGSLQDISQALSFHNKELKEVSVFLITRFRLLFHCSVALNCGCKFVN